MVKAVPVVNEKGQTEKHHMIIHSGDCKYLQSYLKIICKIDKEKNVWLDKDNYKKSLSNIKFLTKFLNMGMDIIQAGIYTGSIKITNLN